MLYYILWFYNLPLVSENLEINQLSFFHFSFWILVSLGRRRILYNKKWSMCSKASAHMH